MSPSDTQARWQAIWAERGWRARLLWPLSWLYGRLMALRRHLYVTGVFKVTRLPVPVIVMGNVVVGGAGKTPATLALLKELQSRGRRPGVVSRGYGRESDGVLEVLDDTPAALGGDEPALIRRHAGVPVFVGSRRVAAAQALMKTHPEVDVIVCDDGLQHLALDRDLAVAVFDNRGTGNGWLLPAGLLREPWPPTHQTFRPDFLLVQRTATADASPVPAGGAPVFGVHRRLAPLAHGPHGEACALDDLAKAPHIVALAGIARPQSFFDMLRARGLHPAQTFALPDHAPLAAYRALSFPPGATVLCTEKDAVKLFTAWQTDSEMSTQLWSIGLETDIDPAFFDAVMQRLPGPGDARLSSRHGHETA